MDRLKDAAMLLKAKITKDETEELLIQATSEENWQTPTPILHQLCQVAYNYEEWQKIQSFIWEKLKLKKWKKVMKTLNLVEFILKNGPGNTISSFKHEVYTFRSFDSFSCHEDGVDRGEAIRQKAKAIVQLLTNQEFLEEERTKAKTIKERMGESAGSGSTYKGMGSKGFGSGASKYDSYDNKGKGKSSSGYGSSSYGGGSSTDYNNSYESGSSNLNKYKKNLGGESAYKKTTEEKKQSEQPKKKEVIVEQSAEDETIKKEAPKPFNQQGRKLLKPGEVPAPVVQAPTQKVNAPKTTNTTSTTQPASGGFNFFDDQPAPVKPQTVTPVAPPPVQTQQVNPQINLTQPQNTSLPFGQFMFPQQPTPAPQQNTFVSQPQTGGNFYGGQTAPQQQINLGFTFNQQPAVNQQPNFGYQPQQPQQPQQPSFNMNQQTNQGLLGLGNITMNPTPAQNKPTYTMNSNNIKDDEFGGFDQGHKEITWMSAAESSLVGLDDLSKEVNEKNVAKDKKKSPNEGNLLATSEDFDFMSAPSSNFNLGMNFGGVSGYPAQNQWHGAQQGNQMMGGISFF